MIYKENPAFLVDFYNGVQAVIDPGELQRLHDSGMRFTVLGQICDDEDFGDSCSTDCIHYCQGTCPMTVLHDYTGARWHVLYHEVHHNH